ncbi:MAG: hydroxymethylbilane synthase [Homoserinimonas sp.]|nr:hydroxymethylbilane synthase [Homoserinimonas sp.]
MTLLPIRIGTRASALALAQTGLIADQVAKISGQDVHIVPIKTEGDVSRESLASLGGTGVFASALREALLADSCDLVVHSLKDLPTLAAPGLRIGAVPKRADARDALITRGGLDIDALAPQAQVGTGSPRRAAQLKAHRADLRVIDIRGNVDTRLARVAEGDLDAVVLAAAGLTRLGRLEAVTQFFELTDWPSAPGQGALALEVRENTSAVIAAVLKKLDHSSSRLSVLAERAVLATLEAGCAAPIGATAIIDSDLLLLTATVYSPDGSDSITSSQGAVLEGSPAERDALALDLGKRAAEDLLRLGAASLAPLR